ncbi:mitochondrial import receptor subunit TOM20, partial [Tanacetum coccineum]
AVLKLEEARTIDPAKHEAHWCLGNVHNVYAFLTSDLDKAKILFDEALRCFQKAVDESPGTEHYLKSLASNAELRKLHKDSYTQEVLGQAQQTLGGGPAESSRATRSAKNKSSDLKYDICGWVIFAVGIFIWIGMAQSRMPPPPAS